jgi:hypothetical protein
MNWNVFYTINQEYLYLLLLGATYFVMVASVFLVLKYLMLNLKEDEGVD